MAKDDFKDEDQGGFKDDVQYGPDEDQEDTQDDQPEDQPEREPEDTGDDQPEPEEPTTLRIKVSDDRGQTWYPYDLDVTVDFEDSGLRPGQLFVMNGEKFEVFAGEFGDVMMRKVERKSMGIPKPPMPKPKKPEAPKAGKRK